MQSLLSLLKKIIFLSFILFTIFAGKGRGCGCRNQSNPSPPHSSQGNSSGKQSSSSNQSNKEPKTGYQETIGVKIKDANLQEGSFPIGTFSTVEVVPLDSETTSNDSESDSTSSIF